MTSGSRFVSFSLLLAVTVAAFRSPLAALIKLSLGDERYSYVALMPAIVVGLIFLRRKAIFLVPRYCPAVGMPLLILGTMLASGATLRPDAGSESQRLSITVLGIVLIWIAGFIGIFGLHVISAARFPFGLLFLMIPIPVWALSYVVSVLQNGSAYLSDLLFKALRVPALRQGVFISLPGFDIEIAEQCSGIRSSMALTLVSALAGYIFLKGLGGRLFLIALTIPVVILKNALRIVTLSSLALYVNRGFLFGRLHRYGGLCFSLLDLIIVIPLLLRLSKSEAHRRSEGSTLTEPTSNSFL